MPLNSSGLHGLGSEELVDRYDEPTTYGDRFPLGDRLFYLSATLLLWTRLDEGCNVAMLRLTPPA